MNIIVMGARFGGIATAIRLQAHGHQVTLIDKRDKLGRRAYVYKQDGFKFDADLTTEYTSSAFANDIWYNIEK